MTDDEAKRMLKSVIAEFGERGGTEDEIRAVFVFREDASLNTAMADAIAAGELTAVKREGTDGSDPDHYVLSLTDVGTAKARALLESIS